MPIGRWKIALFFLVSILGVLFFGCFTYGKKEVATFQWVLEESGFVEVPYGFLISDYTVPPCHVILPVIAKNPRILLHKGAEAPIEMLPVRSGNGEYLLEIQECFSNPPKKLATLSGKTGLASVFLAGDGRMVTMYDQWQCALFFSSSGDGLIAWRSGFSGFLPLFNPEGIPDRVRGINWKDEKDTPPCYRRFFLKGGKHTSGPHLLHEIWPGKEESTKNGKAVSNWIEGKLFP